MSTQVKKDENERTLNRRNRMLKDAFVYQNAITLASRIVEQSCIPYADNIVVAVTKELVQNHNLMVALNELTEEEFAENEVIELLCALDTFAISVCHVENPDAIVAFLFQRSMESKVLG